MSALDTALRIGRVLVAVFLLALVVVFAIQAVPGLVGAEESYVVLSNSMSPSISPGDAVIVGSVAPADVEVGDVITFRRGAEQPPVTHRVQRVIRDDGGVRFQTAGDNNEDADPWTVGPEALVGEVWFTIPYVGHVVTFGNSAAGAAVLIGVPIGLLLLSELWSSAGSIRVSTAGEGGEDGDKHAEDGDGPGAAADGAVDEVTIAATVAGADAVADEVDGVDSSHDGAAAGEDETASLDDESSVTEDDEDVGGVVITASELRLGALGFGTFAIYAAYTAIQDPSGLSIGVTVGAGIAAIFHLAAIALFHVHRRGDDGSDEGAATESSSPDDEPVEPTPRAAGGGGDD